MADEEKSSSEKRLETYTGLLLAVFAALLAIADLGGGKYGGDEMIAVNEKSGAHMWYQSKSIKEALAEGRKELLVSMLETGLIAEDKKNAVEGMIQKIDKKIDKYGKEKNEILLGSKKVGEANWVQEVDGKKGQVIGAKEWEETAAKLGNAGDYFDYATLFLQLCLVLGAISLISSTPKSKINFLIGMVVIGVIGTVICFYGFYLANL